MNEPRIVSFLPAATEMVFALGLGDNLAGVSHECDFPPEARSRPVVVRPALRFEKMSPGEIDAAVSGRLAGGQSLYEVDESLLRRLAPDLILTQNLCQVCAPSGNELAVALQRLAHRPAIVWMSPHSLEDIFGNIRDLAGASGRREQAAALIAACRRRLEAIETKTRNIPSRPRVFCMEWADPVYCAGHWAPEMVELAGGADKLARKGRDSVRVAWDEVVKYAPEILILSPCGFHLGEAMKQVPLLKTLPFWTELPAVRNGKTFCVDANSHLARPGPRVVEGTELLAGLIHPEVFERSGPADAFQPFS
ncbi:MAG: cobalamin-binding protein [Verrucomicrobia bacterium]|nr:cobalamin-binding protein [Verrucomicrobiota bacterium]MDE3098484.1 cobalamin-binding protein [Verrucomicrobiota bacterium]